MQKLLDAVAELDVDAVVTTGRGLDLATLRAPASAHLEPYLDHDAVQRHADLVVGNGGHGRCSGSSASPTRKPRVSSRWSCPIPELVALAGTAGGGGSLHDGPEPAAPRRGSSPTGEDEGTC